VKFPFPFGKQIWDIKEGENGSGTGINSRATCRKMCCLNGSRKLLTQKILQIRIVGVRMDFPHEVRFSAGIGPAHFLAETTRPLGPRLSAFSPTCPSFYIEGYKHLQESIFRLKLKPFNLMWTIQPYTKFALSQAYFPYASYKTAARHLNRWIQNNRELSEELHRTGYDKNQRHFTSRQVELIFSHLGEP
jgi:hypothetical protein